MLRYLALWKVQPSLTSWSGPSSPTGLIVMDEAKVTSGFNGFSETKEQIMVYDLEKNTFCTFLSSLSGKCGI